MSHNKESLKARKLMLKVNSSAFRLTVGVVLVNLFIYLLVGVSIFKKPAAVRTSSISHNTEPCTLLGTHHLRLPWKRWMSLYFP